MKPDRGRGITVGTYFIRRDPSGRPIAAGRIVKGIGAETYALGFTFKEDDSTPTSMTVAQMIATGLELWLTEPAWQAAFTNSAARAGRSTNGTER